MELFKTIEMEHEGRRYEIRVYFDERVVNVVAFRDHRPANGYRLQVQIPKGRDARDVLHRYPMDELTEACRRLMEGDTWPRAAEAINVRI